MRVLRPVAVSVLVHAVLAALVWWAASKTVLRAPFLRVSLVGGGSERAELLPLRESDRDERRADRTNRGALPDRRGVPAGREGHRPLVAVVSTVDSTKSAEGRASARPRATGLFEGSAASEWWRDRSLVSYLESCRRGDVPRDSVLDLPRPPEEIALARATEEINQLTSRLHWDWALEKFRERFAESFPAMR